MGNAPSVPESPPKSRLLRRSSNFIGANRLRPAKKETPSSSSGVAQPREIPGPPDGSQKLFKPSYSASHIPIENSKKHGATNGGYEDVGENGSFEYPQDEFIEHASPRRSSGGSSTEENNVIHDDLINKDDDEIEANVLLDYMSRDGELQDVTVPVGIKWKGPAREVYVIGLFTDWLGKVRLNPIGHDEFAVQLFLRIGYYRFQFIVDGEVRCSNNLPKATEANGNFVNWFEVVRSDGEQARRMLVSKPAQHYSGKVSHNSEEDYFGPMADSVLELGPSHTVTDNEYRKITEPILTPVPRKKVEYTSEIPAIYTETDDFDQRVTDLSTFLKMKKIPEPPLLPPYLNNVLLNKRDGRHGTSPRNTPGSNPTNDSNVLGVPNHVILNHLITTSIKNNVLAVACINRYAGKFITQVTYSPIDKD